MGIIIKPGTTEQARRELWAFTNAFTAMQMGTREGKEFWYVFDATDAEMYRDMQENEYLGVFDAVNSNF